MDWVGLVIWTELLHQVLLEPSEQVSSFGHLGLVTSQTSVSNKQKEIKKLNCKKLNIKTLGIK